jgi:hypothetical protein
MEPALSSVLRDAGFRHAFFTRAGGVSEGAFGSLNFAWSTGDREPLVRENLKRGAAYLGIDAEHLYFLSQVHGAHAHVVSRDDRWDDVVLVEGDAMVSRDPAVACGVRVADCVPILVGDVTTGATCAIHSGWRGTVLDVVGSGIAALRRVAPGASRLVAAVGPHISLESFEVGPEVADEIERACALPGAVDRDRFAKPHVDLRVIVDAQLRKAGVEVVDHITGCTFRDPDRFFSFRRDGRASGRHLAAIVPRDNSL